ncbi:hypothetical protein SDC9_102478 [bioreactor metagenome]|uniref:Uncharacterized protein n=1 Tax=bioreactor metagenome TaxID=1076179 RepID=A0A645ATP8_9ZZZZ
MRLGPRSPVLLGLRLQNGLQKRIEAAESDLAVGPVLGGVAEDVEQLLARFLVELRRGGNLLEHDDEARLRAGLVQRVGHAVEQGVEILSKVRREHELLGDQVQDVLFGLGMGQIGVQKVIAHGLGSRLQVLDAIGANGLDDIGANSAQQRVLLIVTKWHFHLRCSFLLDIHKKMNDSVQFGWDAKLCADNAVSPSTCNLQIGQNNGSLTLVIP